jgi:hypothetical protein
MFNPVACRPALLEPLPPPINRSPSLPSTPLPTPPFLFLTSTGDARPAAPSSSMARTSRICAWRLKKRTVRWASLREKIRKEEGYASVHQPLNQHKERQIGIALENPLGGWIKCWQAEGWNGPGRLKFSWKILNRLVFRVAKWAKSPNNT